MESKYKYAEAYCLMKYKCEKMWENRNTLE